MAAHVVSENTAAGCRRGQWSLVRQLEPSKGTDWALKFRIVRFYSVPAHGKNDPTLELIVHDEEGNRVHAQIKENLPKYQNFFKEGELFAIRNFSVKDNNMNYRTVDTESLIQFGPRTDSKKINPTGFPTMIYQFQNFRDLNAQEVVNDHMLIDVIGLIVGRGRERTSNGHVRRDRLLELTLEDAEGIRIGCTLWGQYIDIVDQHFNEDRNDVVIILQMCRPRRYDGLFSVSTSFHITKIVLDGNSDAVTEFRSRLSRDGEDSNTIGSLQLTPQSTTFFEQLHNGNLQLTTVAELIQASEVGSYWILGEISSIDNCVDWFYLGCSDCNKKVIPEGSRFRCSGCKSVTGSTTYRYKITASLLDSMAETQIILWDTESTNLLGKTATEMREFMAKKHGNPNTFPLFEIKALVGTRALFKIILRKNVGETSYSGPKAFGISEMVIDPDILKLYEVFQEPVDDSFWNDVDGIESPEKIGSSQNTMSSDVTQKRKMHVLIDVDEIVPKSLDGDFSSSSSGEKLKTVKIEK